MEAITVTIQLNVKEISPPVVSLPKKELKSFFTKVLPYISPITIDKTCPKVRKLKHNPIIKLVFISNLQDKSTFS